MAVGPTDPQLVLKVTPPRIPRTVLERPRLSSTRPELADKAVIALQATAGSGKTSLLAQWRKEALQAGAVVAWLTLDDRDNDSRLALGLAAAMWASSGRPTTCLGYLHAPEKTVAEFCDGYWQSGDFGRIDANGYVYVLDRVQDTIRCRGTNVYPSHVEAAISAHPRVMMSAAVGISDPDCGEYVHVEVVVRPGESLDVEELRAFLAERLRGHPLPRTISITNALPPSPVGKVLRRKVRDACRDKAGAN